LGNSGVVGSGGTLNVNVLAAVSETNEPPFSTSRLEGNLEVALVSVGSLVPEGDSATIVVVSAILVQSVLVVNFGD